MGLDSYILVREKKSEIEEIYNKLAGEKEEFRELLYWRKFHELIDWFCNLLNCSIENCEDYPITEEHLRLLLEELKNPKDIFKEYYNFEGGEEMIKKQIAVLEKVLKWDLSNFEFVFHNWW